MNKRVKSLKLYMLSACQLRNAGVLTNDGKIPGLNYEGKAVLTIVALLQRAIATYGVDNYLQMRIGDLPFPECIVRDLIRKNGDRLKEILGEI